MEINSAVPTVFVKYDIREKWSILVKDQAIHPLNNISHAVNSVVALSKPVTESDKTISFFSWERRKL